MLPPWRLTAAASLCNLGAHFHFGFQIMLLNPTKDAFRPFLNTTLGRLYDGQASEESFAGVWALLVALVFVGALTSLATLPAVANHLGRKRGLYVATSGVLAAAVPSGLSLWAESLGLFAAGRLLYGASIGLACGLVGLYQNEVSPRESRGFVGALSGVAIQLGQSVAALVGLPWLLGTETLWPWIFAVESIPCVALLCCLPFFPESPKFLLAKGRAAEAKRAIRVFQSDPTAVEASLKDTEAEIAAEKESPGFAAMLREAGARKGMLVGTLVTVLVPISGITAVNFFTTTLLIEAGAAPTSASLYNLAIVAAGLVPSCLGAVVLDRWGRRPVLLASNWVLVACNVLFFAAFLAKELVESSGGTFDGATAMYLCGAGVFLFVFVGGVSPLMWLITCELVPFRFKAHASSVALTAHYVSSIVAGFGFLPLFTGLGSYAYLFFVFPAVGLTLALHLLLPETKGRSSLEVQAALVGGSRVAPAKDASHTESKH